MHHRSARRPSTSGSHSGRCRPGGHRAAGRRHYELRHAQRGRVLRAASPATLSERVGGRRELRFPGDRRAVGKPGRFPVWPRCDASAGGLVRRVGDAALDRDDVRVERRRDRPGAVVGTATTGTTAVGDRAVAHAAARHAAGSHPPRQARRQSRRAAVCRAGPAGPAGVRTHPRIPRRRSARHHDPRQLRPRLRRPVRRRGTGLPGTRGTARAHLATTTPDSGGG